jgi:four helix bundle protein
MDFVIQIYPKEEKYCLIDQIRRACISIPSNIAEGSGRNSDKDFIRFLYISLGSANEVETQIVLSQRLNYLNDEDFTNLLNRLQNIKKMLSGLINHLNEYSCYSVPGVRFGGYRVSGVVDTSIPDTRYR